MELTEGLLAALVVSIVVAAIARRMGWGIALPVLGVGVVFGFLPVGPRPPENAGEVFLFVLAPLVFGEALSSSYFDIRRFRRPILALAVGLVVVSSVAVGLVASAVVPAIPLAIAFCLGAILSPTDAVAVAAVAKRASLPRRVVTILEGESLVNDGTGLTLLRVGLAAAAAGALSGGEIAVVLVQSVLGGLGVGVLVGILLALVVRRGSDSLIANSLILVAPFPTYLVAEQVQGSGILAVVAAALITTNAMVGEAGFRGRAASVATWRQISFVLQAFAFFLVGLELPETVKALTPDNLRALPVLVLAVLVTLFVARAGFVLIMVAISRWTPGEKLGLSDAAVLAWAGTRGPVSGLAAFSVPVTLVGGEIFPERRLLLATTFVVIVITLLLAPTLRYVAKAVRLRPDDDALRAAQVRGALAARGVERLDEVMEQALLTNQPVSEEAADAVRARLLAELHVHGDGDGLHDAADRARQAWYVESQVVKAQQEELLRLRDDEAIPDAILRPIQAELDAQQAALKARRPA